MRAPEDEAERTARLNQVKAEPADGEPENELEHFATCSTCGQTFDMRPLGDASYHYKARHKPLTRS